MEYITYSNVYKYIWNGTNKDKTYAWNKIYFISTNIKCIYSLISV